MGPAPGSPGVTASEVKFTEVVYAMLLAQLMALTKKATNALQLLEMPLKTTMKTTLTPMTTTPKMTTLKSTTPKMTTLNTPKSTPLDIKTMSGVTGVAKEQPSPGLASIKSSAMTTGTVSTIPTVIFLRTNMVIGATSLAQTTEKTETASAATSKAGTATE